MKKTISIFLLVAVMFSLFGCAEKRDDDADPVSSDNVPQIRFETDEPSQPETAGAAPETDETAGINETETVGETENETVREPIRVDGLTLDKYEVDITVGSYDMPWVTMTPYDADDKSELWTSSDTAIASVDAYGNIYGIAAGDCTVTVASVDNPSVKADVAVHVKEKPVETTAAQADTTTAAPPVETPPASANGVTYIDGILIANKTYALPADYNPGVDPTAYAALTEMFSGAYAEGITLWIASGFRSYDTQAWLYNNYVAMDGKAAADTYSARPGHSEHQTGLAFDLNYVADFFATTPEGIWLADNCWKYGFIIRYPAGKESITGYKYEPWHVRYLGKDVAKKVYESGLCLEEYLGITSVYSY